jgi:hypothetical protein
MFGSGGIATTVTMIVGTIDSASAQMASRSAQDGAAAR